MFATSPYRAFQLSKLFPRSTGTTCNAVAMDFPMSGIFTGGLPLLELELLLELDLELELLAAMVVFLPLACLASLFKAWAVLLFMHEVYLLSRLTTC